MIKSTAAFTGLATLSPWWHLLASGNSRKYRISACDWSIGKTSEVEALELGSRIGLDGVQVSLGTVRNDMHLRQAPVQQAYKAAAKQHGVQVSSLAIGELNNVPYKSAPETEAWVSDSIDVAQAMGCKVILLAFFSKGDLKGDEAGQQEVIRRLKKVAPKAEKAGVILGIESWLSADEHLAIIHAVGSKNVRVYYDVANSHLMGYDIYEEMRRLGREYICEVHAKENGFLLGQGKIDFARVKSILDDIRYDGWVIIEGAVPKDAEMFPSYQANNQYLRSVLNKA
jgi:L-ribulose-5-phosphate 3-epimerase